MASPRGFWWAAVVLAAGCGQRDRLTFPTEDPGNGSGPTTEITLPGVSDTAVVEGDLLLVRGRTFDADGVDTVYFEVGGVNQGFAPIIAEGADTVDFALQLSTLGNSGATVLLRVYGVDLLGVQGSPVTRQIHIE